MEGREKTTSIELKMRKFRFTDWFGVLLYIGVAVVCFCQNEILGGIGWVFAALWLSIHNVMRMFFVAMREEILRLKGDEDGQQ
jgi:hypothetical protein